MSDAPSDLADDVRAARDRLAACIAALPAERWTTPLSADDPRPTGVVCDHVAHSYEYLAGWVRDLLAGGDPVVGPALVDELNLDHAGRSSAVTPESTLEHLQRSGDVFIELVRAMTPADLERADGRVRAFVAVAIRHPDGHRVEIEAAG
jgi:hypothetical protein